MTDLQDRLDRAEALQGVDVTQLLGREDRALDRLVAAKAAVEGNPSLANCREYVNAHDAFWGLMMEITGHAA